MNPQNPISWSLIEKPLVFAFVFVATIALGNITYTLMRRAFDVRLQPRNSKFLARFAESTIFVAGLYIGIYYVLRLDLRALATSLGVLTVAVAFSAQQVGQNLVAGMLIWVRRTIWYEDWVEIGSTGLARVKDISLFQTVLRHRDGRVISLPNLQLISLPIVNYTRSGFVEVPMTVTLPGTSDPATFTRVALQVADSHPSIMPNVAAAERKHTEHVFQLLRIKAWVDRDSAKSAFAPRVLVEDVSDGKVRYSVRVWIHEVERRETIVSEYLTALHERLSAPA